jgi:hypothetical protein
MNKVSKLGLYLLEVATITLSLMIMMLSFMMNILLAGIKLINKTYNKIDSKKITLKETVSVAYVNDYDFY